MTKERVAVALSGGLDSSVAALLLKDAGYEILGVYMRLWDLSHAQRLEHRAEYVCHTLGISFHVLDLQKEFEHCVIDYFCQEYRRGRTPNPCIACNQHVKFGFLLDRALSLGVDYLATGHYARIEKTNGICRLLRAKDMGKDQSYFLYTLDQSRLSHLLFPLGNYSKTEVRQLAQRKGLSPAIRPSQDLCFIAQKSYHVFLNQHFPSMPGDILDTQGAILGHHRGIAFYTIGQRHGLGVASNTPLYVTKIEPENNRIVLGNKDELYKQEVMAKDLTWVAGGLPFQPVAVSAQIRYKSAATEAVLFPKKDSARIRFSQPQWAVTPGQAIVFYRDDELLGGGIID
ncbi:MAG: tRNA 2-thiouridine(34) synthase MnmA [Dehalococcoidia bacterium]|nr:tRNA 2-thiouridine(34) synthase MnmA [Dehalococcoidia bacterium]